MNIALLSLLGLGGLWLTSCSTPPARLVREVRLSRTDPGALLSLAIAEPRTPRGRQALGHFMEHCKQAGWRQPVGLPAGPTQPGLTYRVFFPTQHRGSYPLDYFDEIRPAADFEVKKLPHHLRQGEGVPLMALRENRGQDRLESFYPPEVISRPLTALLRPGPKIGQEQEVRIDLLCPLLNDTVQIDGQQRPLAADFSVPWAAILARSGKLNQRRVLDMITRQPRREPRLYLMEPYDPNKEPLIMIHGLLSSPLAWAELSNELWADDRIRRRYQIWHYLYNTSAPALYASRLLRTQMKELRQMLDPEGDDPASRKTTLITHSMGGIVGKALAMEPGDAFWKAAFKVPPDQLKLSPKDRAMLKDAFEWKADPSIHRILFICTPHLGSGFADNLVGRVGSWLTNPPSLYRDFYRRISQFNPAVFTPDYEALGQGRLDSVHALSPKQPTLRILANLPFAHSVKTHSIIGNRGKPGPLPQSSDGIVPYTSSHFAAALSERIVPAGHDALKHPETFREVRRILSEAARAARRP